MTRVQVSQLKNISSQSNNVSRARDNFHCYLSSDFVLSMICFCFLGGLNFLSTGILADCLVGGHQCDNSNEEATSTTCYRRPRARTTTWNTAKSKHAATNAPADDFIGGSFPYHYTTVLSLQNHLFTSGNRQPTKHRS